ncbi:hypothetical protein HWV07_10575 [Natronomonas salina]|nr:hypothetical protein HWV07_10575 [Natronomonas salina]
MVNRLFQVAIVGALLDGVRRRDPSVVTNGAVSLAFAALPRRIESARGVRFRPWQRLWVSAAGLVHTLGMLGPYDRVWWWDHLTHTLTGVVVAGAADVGFRSRPTLWERAPSPFDGRATWIAGVTVGFGLLWELLEYGVHAVAERRGFEPLLVHYGRFDTVVDVGFDLLGAGLVVRFGEAPLSNLVDAEPDDPSTEGKP